MQKSKTYKLVILTLAVLGLCLSLVPASATAAESAPATAASHDDGCDDPCEGESPDGECAEGCMFCACCPASMPLVTHAPVVVAPRAALPNARAGVEPPRVVARGVPFTLFKPPRAHS